MKITVQWERNNIFDKGRSKFNKGDFSGGVNEVIIGCWVGLSSISRVSHECLRGQLGIILGDNPAGHCSVLKNLVPTSFSQ